MPKIRKDEPALREAMEKEGVPAAVIDHVMALEPARWIYWLGAWSYVVVMVAGFGVGAILWSRVEAIVDDTAVSRAAEIGGLLYKSNFGIGFVFLLFAWILISGVLVTAVAAKSARVRASYFLFTLLDPKNRISLTFNNRLSKLAAITDPEEYIRSAVEGSNKAFLSVGVLLTAAGFAFVDWELNTFNIYSAEGYLSTPLLPWDHDKTGKWRDAEYVELGCNHVTGKNASDDIIYEIRVDEKTSFRISDAAPVKGDLLDQIEAIDTELREADISFRRWEWLKRNPLHPSCLAAQRRKYSANDYNRIIRLLRVGEFPSD